MDDHVMKSRTNLKEFLSERHSYFNSAVRKKR